MVRRGGTDAGVAGCQRLAIDLVLLDLHMPVLDGEQAMRQMRAAGFTGPIVGLTADHAERSAAEWFADGYAWHPNRSTGRHLFRC